MSQELPYIQQIRDTSNTTLDVLLTNVNANVSSAYNQANSAYALAQNAVTAAAAANTVANQGVSAAAYALSVAENAYATANGAVSQGNQNAINITSVNNTAYSALSQAGIATSSASTAQSTATNATNLANQALSNSGVGAGSYGNGLNIPVITVDARGRITSAYNTGLTNFSPSNNGAAPASGGGTSNFLRADGAWTPPPLTSLPGNFTAGSSGFVPASGGGTTNFLRADGGWTVPPGLNNSSISAQGFLQFENGVILQWGSFAFVAGASPGPFGPYGMHTQFQSACYYMGFTGVGQSGSAVTLYQAPSKSQNGGWQFYVCVGSGNAGYELTNLYWWALGY